MTTTVTARGKTGSASGRAGPGQRLMVSNEKGGAELDKSPLDPTCYKGGPAGAGIHEETTRTTGHQKFPPPQHMTQWPHESRHNLVAYFRIAVEWGLHVVEAALIYPRHKSNIRCFRNVGVWRS